MSDNNFQPIFDYIDQSITELKEEIPSKADFLKLQSSIETLAGRFSKVDERSLVTEAKAERIEQWVITAAEETNVPYNP